MATVIDRQPGMASSREMSGSVQYIGGYIGPMDEAGLQDEDTSKTLVPMGLEVFEKVDKLVATQVVSSDEAWYNMVEFAIDDGQGTSLLSVKEIKSLNGCLQALMGSMRPSYLKVINTVTTNWIMELEQPSSCISPVFCPWAAPSLTVRMPTGEVLGHIKHAARETCGSWVPPSYYFDVYDYQGNRKYRVQGPSCYPCECTQKKPVTFKIYTEGNANENGMCIGEITHEWRGCCGGMCSCCITGDPDHVTITFPQDSSAEDKALFLGLLLLVIATYLEVQ